MIYKIVFSNSPQTPARLNCEFWLRNPPDVCAHMWGYYFGHTCVFSVATIITIKSVGRFRLPTVQLLYNTRQRTHEVSCRRQNVRSVWKMSFACLKVFVFIFSDFLSVGIFLWSRKYGCVHGYSHFAFL